MTQDRLDRRETEQLNGFLRKIYRAIKESDLVEAKDHAAQLGEHIDLLIMVHDKDVDSNE